MAFGVQPNFAEAPTNPLIRQTSDTDGNRIYTAILPNDDISVDIDGFGGSITEYSNLTNTKGFRIKCYDALTGTGVQFNPTDFDTGVDSTTRDYFVLIYSDNDKKHHFAKIKEIFTDDVVGDAFEFEPKIGNEIPKDTKFIIFKGDTRDKEIIAISAGILNDETASTGLNLSRNLVCARPLFYFYNSHLDKENELDHNTKYYLVQEDDDGTNRPYTLDSSSTGREVFRTVQDFGKVITDYSKYGLRITVTDKLRDLDTATGSNFTSNEGNTGVANVTNYDTYFVNATRDNDDDISAGNLVYTGAKRYLHYDHSPLKANFTYGVHEHTTEDSVSTRGGMSESKIVDPSRIMGKKITEFTDYKVRHNIHREDLDGWFELDASFATASSRDFTIETRFDLADFLNVNDEIKIGDRIFIVGSIGTFNNFPQALTVDMLSRLESDPVFETTVYAPTAGDKIYRRAYNYVDKTLMVDVNLIDNRFSKLSVSFTSDNMDDLYASVTSVEAEKKLLTLSFTGNSYYNDPMRYASGEYFLYVERFNGEIEEITSKKELGQTVFEVKGRDKYNQLISPVVNSNSLFSEEIIYSTNSPYNRLGNVRSASNFTITLGQTTWQTGIACDSSGTGPNFDNFPVVGSKLFTVNGYIGEVLTSTIYDNSGTPSRQYTITPAITQANTEAIYVDTEKNYIFSKALGTSHLSTTSPTSLTGAANKGVFFTAGNEIDTSTGVEGNSLVGTSSNSNPNAIGYAINSPSSIDKDRAFQSKLADEFGTGSDSTFDTVNTLIDFEIVNTKKKDNTTEIELAPYVPITLGRQSEYYNDTDNYVFTEVATVTALQPLASLIDGESNFTTTSTTAYTLKKDDALFAGDSKEFVGKVSYLMIDTDSTGHSIMVFLDRTIYDFTVNEKIYTANIPMNDLILVNGSHLWGGKMLSLIHPKIDSTYGTIPLNVENTNGSADYTAKYGFPLYSPSYFGFGNFDTNKGRFVFRFSSTNIPFNKYYPNPTELDYIQGSYKVKPNITGSDFTNREKTDSAFPTLPLDIRGRTGVLGSNSTDVRVHTEDESTAFVYDRDITEINTKFFNIDESAIRLFLYVNSDLLPYSSIRKDSLMNTTARNLTNYSMLLVDNRNVKGTAIQSGNILGLRDSNFQTLNFASDTTVSSLKRFGMMRLTELCVDVFFNPVNPEKKINKEFKYDISVDVEGFEVTNLGPITSITNTTIVFDIAPTPALTSGDRIYDTFGNFIGTISSGSGNTYTLSANGHLTKAGVKADTAIKLVRENLELRGRNRIDTFDDITENSVHPLKVAITPEGTSYNANLPSEAEINLPYFLKQSAVTALSSIKGSTVQMFADVIAGNSNIYTNSKGVILDTFDIEDGQEFRSIETGSTTAELKELAKNAPLGMVADILSTGGGTTYTYWDGFFLTSNTSAHFKIKDNPRDNATSYDAKGVTGAYMVFKPTLVTNASTSTTPSLSTNTTITSSNGNLNHAVIDTTADNGLNSFLRFVDLTGCYLVPEAGTNGISSFSKTGIAKNMNDIEPDELIYVVSHEVDDSTITSHHLITDVALTDSTRYRILQPNETFSYDFFPKTIRMNTLSHTYTKTSQGNSVYSFNNSYFYQDGTPRGVGNTAQDEGVLSMFVAVDLDGQSSDNGVVIKDASNFFTSILPKGQYNMYLSDGDTGRKVNIISNEDGEIILSKSSNLKGAISASETFVVTSLEELKIEPKRACIGTTATLCLEAEDLINEVMEQESLNFETTQNDYPVYLAPNFKGIDLFSAIRFIADKKDMVLIEENGTFKITPDNDSRYYSNITLNDTGEFRIYQFEKSTTLYDFHNEVIVYGNVHKSIRKDIRSIKKRGRKTLEHHDKTLITQEEVDKKALDLLRLHTTFNQKLILTVNSKGLSQLRAGDIINVEIEQENVELSEYIVLQIEHDLRGLMKLELGKYSKQLSDLFSELLITTKQINSNIRNDKFNDKTSGFSFLESLRVKELKLTVRKRSTTGDFPLGFRETLNTGSDTLGFDGGSVTITDLVEEELI